MEHVGMYPLDTIKVSHPLYKYISYLFAFRPTSKLVEGILDLPRQLGYFIKMKEYSGSGREPRLLQAAASLPMHAFSLHMST
jgi:hypothetical protein